MKISVVSTALLLTFGVAHAIRNLKEGPMIDAEGREYKSPPARVDQGGPGGLANAIRVHCEDTSVTVVVRENLLKRGRLAAPGELFLGEALDPRCRAAPTTDGEYTIRADLRACGFETTASEDSVVYSNKLVFTASFGSRGRKRIARTVVPVSCRYERATPVSGDLRRGLASPPVTQRHAFALLLMADDWIHETTSNAFYLGDAMRLQASYTAPDSGLRRVFVDSCVATLSPDPRSVPRYYFIENHGCLVDAKQGGFASQFQPRQADHSLRLNLDVFLFDGDARNSIFITCQLTVTSKGSESGVSNKACNYEASRWKNVDGNDDVCRCCDSTCSQGRKVGASQKQLPEILACGSVSVGPLMVYPNK